MEYVIKFTEPELDLILKALGELPARMSLQMINKIYAEIGKQAEDFSKKMGKTDLKQVK